MRWVKEESAGDAGWVHIAIVVAMGSNRTPRGRRSVLSLTVPDANKFGIAAAGSAAVEREVEIRGMNGTCSVRLVATVRHLIQDPGALSVLAVDPLLGALTIDGNEGVWSWRVPTEGKR